MLVGTGFISVTSTGTFRVDSTSLPHMDVGEGKELSAQVQLPSSGHITIARTHITQSKAAVNLKYNLYLYSASVYISLRVVVYCVLVFC